MFYEEFRRIIEKRLKERHSLENIVSQLKELSNNTEGKIAFYPCGRLSAEILKEVKTTCPELIPTIIGCFDKSNKATTERGFDVYNIKDLERLKDNISLLIVASNTFYSKDMKELKNLTCYDGEVLNTSFFDTSLPADLKDYDIMEKIDEVYNLFSDKKSRATYMIAWLSRMLNDEALTYLFESEEEKNVDNEPINYKGFLIHGIDRECKKELFSELYKMKYVFPEEGDVVFDLGAYRGDTSIFFAHHVKENGKVYAFEPIRANYEWIVKNVEDNSLGYIVEPINLAISNKPGILKGISSDTGAPWSYLSEERGTEDVEVTTVDDFVESQNLRNVDYLKMDVEGFEHDVILGAKKTIYRFNPKLAIAVYHFTSDLITLPLELNEVGNYEFYLRAKVEGPFGFTLFAKKNRS